MFFHLCIFIFIIFFFSHIFIYESESEAAQSCPTLCDPIDCSVPGSSVHGIFQARVLEWVAIAFSEVLLTRPYANAPPAQEPLQFSWILRGDLPAVCTGQQMYKLEQVIVSSPLFVPAPGQTYF